MSRWDIDDEGFHITADDWIDEVKQARKIDVSLTKDGLAYVELTFADPRNDRWSTDTLTSGFFVWPHELLNLVCYLEDHPNFKASQEAYNKRYFSAEPYKTRSELQAEIDELKEELRVQING